MPDIRIISQKIVKVRKNQLCWGCFIELPKGVQAERSTCIDGDKWVTCYWCFKCLAFMAHMDPYDLLEGIPKGAIADSDGYQDFKI